MYDADGTPASRSPRMLPRSLTVPPGVPEFMSRERYLDAGPVELSGRAWSGHGAIERVEVSTDGGSSFADADLGAGAGRRRLARLELRLGRRRRANT